MSLTQFALLISLVLNMILIGERFWSWISSARRGRAGIEVIPPDDRYRNGAIKVPSNCLRWDRKLQACIVPGHGKTDVPKEVLAQVKKRRVGLVFSDYRAGQEAQPSLRVIGEYPL